jgi:Ca-activated chloride channel family protein
MRFAAPQYLPLLAIPALLFVLWAWQSWRRQRDLSRMRKHRSTPVRERIPRLGELPFWLCSIAALAATIVALARPIAVLSTLRTAGIDLVILQDGSASMRVKDVTGNRWQRSMQFLRTVGESLRWEDDRIALALFASIAAPQVRLTRDPNTFFFFLDHLEDEPPFRMQDDTTWDTNIERGIYWGMRLIEKDEEIAKATASGGSRAGLQPGRSAGLKAGPATTTGSERKNARAFVLVSDGQAWSGEVAKSIAAAQNRGIPIFVVGVGTTAGGIIPDPNPDPARAVLTSSLDRSSLSVIANAGGGRYFELGRDDDRDIANAIIDSTRRRANTGGINETVQELYWRALLVAAICLGLAVLFLRDQAALTLQLTAAAGVLVLLISYAK